MQMQPEEPSVGASKVERVHGRILMRISGLPLERVSLRMFDRQARPVERRFGGGTWIFRRRAWLVRDGGIYCAAKSQWLSRKVARTANFSTYPAYFRWDALSACLTGHVLARRRMAQSVAVSWLANVKVGLWAQDARVQSAMNYGGHYSKKLRSRAVRDGLAIHLVQ